jgi:hypothetical protein
MGKGFIIIIFLLIFIKKPQSILGLIGQKKKVEIQDEEKSAEAQLKEGNPQLIQADQYSRFYENKTNGSQPPIFQQNQQRNPPQQ